MTISRNETAITQWISFWEAAFFDSRGFASFAGLSETAEDCRCHNTHPSVPLRLREMPHVFPLSRLYSFSPHNGLI